MFTEQLYLFYSSYLCWLLILAKETWIFALWKLKEKEVWRINRLHLSYGYKPSCYEWYFEKLRWLQRTRSFHWQGTGSGGTDRLMPCSSHPLHAFQSLQITKCSPITNSLLHPHELTEKSIGCGHWKEFQTKNVGVFLINIIINSSILKPFFRTMTPLHSEDRGILSVKGMVAGNIRLLYF